MFCYVDIFNTLIVSCKTCNVSLSSVIKNKFGQTLYCLTEKKLCERLRVYLAWKLHVQIRVSVGLLNLPIRTKSFMQIIYRINSELYCLTKGMCHLNAAGIVYKILVDGHSMFSKSEENYNGWRERCFKIYMNQKVCHLYLLLFD